MKNFWSIRSVASAAVMGMLFSAPAAVQLHAQADANAQSATQSLLDKAKAL